MLIVFKIIKDCLQDFLFICVVLNRNLEVKFIEGFKIILEMLCFMIEFFNFDILQFYLYL